MLVLRCARKTRALLSSSTTGAANTSSSIFLFSTYASTSQSVARSSNPVLPAHSAESIASSESESEASRGDVINGYREGFMSRKKLLFDRIFEILRTGEESTSDAALSRLNLLVSETLVLDVLDYHKKDFLFCLKFFDWAGRQPGFHHTSATFNTILRRMSSRKLMAFLGDIQNDMEKRYACKVGYHNVLVIGYALAGKPETALRLFGKMRFRGVDLDAFGYHVLLNSLVEHSHFDMVETVAREIRAGGFQNEVTHSIMIKSFCKQKDFERCGEYLRDLIQNDSSQLNSFAIRSFVDALCKDNQFERAEKFLGEFGVDGLVLKEYACCVRIRGLVKAGKLDAALEFLKDKQALEGYVPDVFRCNMLICKLLKEKKFVEVYDLSTDMKEKRRRGP